MIDRVSKILKVSERRACRVLKQTRAIQRHSSCIRNDEERLAARTIELATQYGRYGQEQDNSSSQRGSVEGEPQESRAHLEKGRLEGAKETTKTRKIMAE